MQFEPDRFAVGEPAQPVLQVWSDSVPQFVGSFGAEQAWAQTEDGVWRLSEDDVRPLRTPEDFGALLAVVQLAAGPVAATDNGLFVLRDDVWIRSPASASLQGRITQVLPGPDAETDLWVATDRALHLVWQGRVDRWAPEGLSTAGCRLAPGAFDGAGVWVGCDADLYALTVQGPRARPEPIQLGGPLVADGRGRLWAVDDGGVLHSRSPSGVWSGHPEVGSVGAMAAVDSGAWFRTSRGFFFFDGSAFRPLVGLEQATLLGPAPPDGAWVARGGELVRVALEPSSSEPEPDGPPTWTRDIQPIFAQRCALCHGPDASARPLHTPQQWQAEIDLILTNIRDGRMPLPPVELLDVEAIERVQRWRQADFPVGEGS